MYFICGALQQQKIRHVEHLEGCFGILLGTDQRRFERVLETTEFGYSS